MPAGALVAWIVLSLLAGPALAECRRLPMEHGPGRTDGPGSFGPLHATVTLDCLTYVGSVSRDGREWVLIRDERGVVHRLTLGGYMGPGVITRIDAEFIYLEASPSGIVRFAKAPR